MELETPIVVGQTTEVVFGALPGVHTSVCLSQKDLVDKITVSLQHDNTILLPAAVWLELSFTLMKQLVHKCYI